MRRGLDIPQQRMARSEQLRRVRLAEDLGFAGARGLDHYLVCSWPETGDLQVEAFVRDMAPEFA
jgi:hypothetical protein